MHFSYELWGIGWAAIELEMNGNHYYGWPSYLTEPLQDLVNGLLSITNGCVPDDELVTQVTFKFDNEPAIDKWELTCVKEKWLRIKIETFEDYKATKGNLVLEEECEIKDFALQLVVSMEKMIKAYGLIGYKETWHRGEFPITGYLKLKNYTEDKVLSDYIEEGVEEGRLLYKSNYVKEIQQLRVEAQ